MMRGVAWGLLIEGAAFLFVGVVIVAALYWL